MNNYVKLSSQVSPHFHKTFKSKKTHQIDKGGRGSTKSSKNALKCVHHLITDPTCNIVGIRRHQNGIRKSIYREIKRAFKRLGMVENVHYKCKYNPMEITYLKHGNSIYFGGLDDYESLKGMIPEENTIKIVWFFEITQFKDEDDIDQVNATFSRGNNDYYIALYEYNPPRNKYHWVNQWTEKMKERRNVRVTHSTYLTVPVHWLGKMFIEEAEMMKENDIERYNWIYGGEITGLEGLIYNYDQIKFIDSLERTEKSCRFIFWN